MKIGSDEHKQRFCDDFIAGHEPYDPIALPWPDLDADVLGRLRAIPFWSEVLLTERRAANDGRGFAATEAGVFIDGFSPLEQIEECCAENDRRVRAFDPELLRPQLLPRLAKAGLPILHAVRRSRRSR